MEVTKSRTDIREALNNNCLYTFLCREGKDQRIINVKTKYGKLLVKTMAGKWETITKEDKIDLR